MGRSSTALCRLFRQSARQCSSQSSPHVISSRLSGITTIALNRPEKRNCVSRQTARQLTDALLAFEADHTSPVAVLYGIGGNFCSGCDINEFVSGSVPPEGDDELPGMVWRRPCAKPVIAAVDGYAVGGGLELALWCDLRVVEERAVLGAFGRRFGIPLQNGGAARLQAHVGLARALDLVVTGRGLTGTEAFQWGLASRVVACGTALGQAMSLATSIAKFPPAGVTADRRALYHAATEAPSLEAALEFERNNARDCLGEARINAKRFITDGVGRHGKTRIHPEKIAKWEQ